MKNFLITMTLAIVLFCSTSFSVYQLDLCREINLIEIDTLSVAGDTYHVKWLLKEDFESGKWRENWVLETTKADVEIKEGKLFMTDYGIGSTLWYKKELPQHIIVKYTTQSERGMTDTKLNFNHFSHARENDGTDLKIGKESGRTGAYVQYHQFTNYIATLTYKHSRIRKDPGFQLLSDSQVYSEENQVYNVVYTVQKGRVRYYLNDVKVHDVRDAQPLRGGKFGLRTWNTHASWENIEIGLVIGSQSSLTLE